MSYNYAMERPCLFTDEGQRDFLKVRDRVKILLKDAGAFMMFKPFMGLSAFGDTWRQMACIDRLVELGEIREVTAHGVPGQCRVFTGN